MTDLASRRQTQTNTLNSFQLTRVRSWSPASSHHVENESGETAQDVTSIWNLRDKLELGWGKLKTKVRKMQNGWQETFSFQTGFWTRCAAVNNTEFTCKSFDARALKKSGWRVAAIVVVVVDDFLLRGRIPPDADTYICRHFLRLFAFLLLLLLGLLLVRLLHDSK